jgi:hypothetical protein
VQAADQNGIADEQRAAHRSRDLHQKQSQHQQRHQVDEKPPVLREDQRRQRLAARAGRDMAREHGHRGQQHRQKRPIDQQHGLSVRKHGIEQRSEVIAQRAGRSEKVDIRHLARTNAVYAS